MPEQNRPGAPSLDESEPLLTLLGKLPQGSPVRRAALQVIRGETPAAVGELMDCLLSPSVARWRERAVAAWTLGCASPGGGYSDATAAVLMDVLDGARRERFGPRLMRAVMRDAAIALPAGLMVFLMEAIFRDFDGYHGWYPPFFGLIVMFSLAAAFFGFPFTMAASLRFDRHCDDAVRAAAALALGRLGVPDSVGTLSGHLFDRDSRVSSAVAASLHALLPTLTSDHYGLFGSESMVRMGRVLMHPDTRLASEMVIALQKVGTSHAIPWARRLASGGRTTRLRDAARELLVTLEARRQKESLGEGLLRPAETADNADSLLRPARLAETDSQLLVRPAE